MKRFLRALAAAAFASVALVSSFAPTGCSEADSGTTGRRVALRTHVTANGGGAPFVNAKGWTVALDEALVATGAFYYFDGATLLSRASAPGARPGLAFVRAAHAHPGHYVPGAARGEMREPFSVDLRAGESVLPDGEGVTGVVRSATFSFGAPAAGPHAGALGEHVAVVRGVATKGEERRAFRAAIDAAEVANTKGAPSVEGCPFHETNVDGDGSVTLRIDLTSWFDQVDFQGIEALADDAPAELARGSLARAQLVRGMKVGSAYGFSFAPTTMNSHSEER